MAMEMVMWMETGMATEMAMEHNYMFCAYPLGHA